ncbi:hypothetical protein E2320_001280, partial [Naja naja]
RTRSLAKVPCAACHAVVPELLQGLSQVTRPCTRPNIAYRNNNNNNNNLFYYLEYLIFFTGRSWLNPEIPISDTKRSPPVLEGAAGFKILASCSSLLPYPFDCDT